MAADAAADAPKTPTLSNFTQLNNNQHIIKSKQHSEHSYNLQLHQFQQLNQYPQILSRTLEIQIRISPYLGMNWINSFHEIDKDVKVQDLNRTKRRSEEEVPT